MGRHVVEMSEQEQTKVVELAREVAVEFARLGPDCDAQNTFPVNLVPVFKESGLVGLPVSKEYGGLGGDIGTVCRVSTELARGDAACGLAFNMHYNVVGMLGGMLDPDAAAVWLPQISRDHKLICGAFSEARAGISGLADTVASPCGEDRWAVTGTKTWATLCQGADLVAFNAVVADEAGHPPADFMQHAAAERCFIVPATTPGITIKETWDAMGMRATGTHSMIFEAVEVEPAGDVGDFRQRFMAQFEWPALTFSAVYQGIALRAYEETCRILRTKSLGATMAGSDVKVREIGYVPHELGRLRIKNEAAQRVLDATVRTVIDGLDGEWHPMARVPLLEVAKVTCTENALDVVSAAMTLIGGASYRRGHVLERLYRDVRSGSFHPLSAGQTADFLGRFDLGLFDPPSAAS